MSTLEKLTIQGIRSFGVNAEDAQSITFGSPVTLILGENGCGKTTVIECLKYALTGESPPGSDRGRSFVHDPKIFDLFESLGQIKLQVRNARGEQLSVCRSIKLSHRRGKFQLETLDSTMNYIGVKDGPSGSKTTDSISKRCIDVDVAMCEFMGVSKAIINNVLFCHQEDSSWPLDEAKKLKEKFDSIFGITEYNKGIEKVIKLRKEQVADLKLKESGLRLLSHIKQETEDKSLMLKNAKEKCEKVKVQCQECESEMAPIEERLAEIQKIEYEVGKHQALKVEMETKQNNCREQIASLSKKIKCPFEGDIQELDQKIREFREKMGEKKSECRELSEQLSSRQLEERNVQKKLVNLDKELCVAMQQQQCEQQCTTQREEKLKLICAQLRVTMTDGVDVSRVIDEINRALISEQYSITETQAQHDSEDQQRQTMIDMLRVDIAKLEEACVTLRKQKGQHEQESAETERKIGDIELSAQRLKKLTAEIERIDDCYCRANAAFNQDEMRQNITDGKQNITQMQQQFRNLDERLMQLTSISKLVSEIALKEEEVAKRENEVRRVKSKHGDNMKRIFAGAVVESNFRRALQMAYEKVRREIKQLNDQSNTLRLREQSCEIKRKNLKEEIVRMEKDLEESKEKVFERCHATAYADLLAKCKANVTKCQLDHGALRSAEAMYKKYMQKIVEDPCCPLCHKGMSENEAMDLSAELSEEIQQLPDNIMRIEGLLKAEEKKYESLLQLQPIIEKVARLEADLPSRKAELSKQQAQLSECASESENLQMLLVEPTEHMDVANVMMGDMSLLDEAMKEMARLKDEVLKLKRKLPEGHDAGVSIDDLQMEKSIVSAELENERSKVDTMQQDYERAMNALNKLRDMKNTFKDEQIQLQEGVQSLPQLKERQIQLAELIGCVVVDLQESVEQVQPLKQRMDSTIEAKARLKELNRETMSEMRTKYEAHKNIDHDIQRLNKEVLDYAKLNLSAKIAGLNGLIESSRVKTAKLSQEISSTAKTLDALKTECSNQENLERDLKDNRELKLLQQKEHDLNGQSAKLSEHLGDLNYRRVSREKRELIAHRDLGTVRKGELLGQLGEINSQVKRLEAEMRETKYKESLDNYRRGLYEVEVVRRIIADLGQYRIALEWSLMRFHEEKMQKINRLIREYWRLIYRGNDIDYIQIQTDAVNIDSSADCKRSFNYRVIQSKNSSEIDMRGRCSAGQRVLASLIIRMALAETFSANCAVLALDEPTTNLDRINIMSLCDALNRIVEERPSDSNFMLIIITHDEDFISTLSKIESYHRVFRNDECKSVIRQVKVA